MKEIKFRAWSEHLNQYFECVTVPNDRGNGKEKWPILVVGNYGLIDGLDEPYVLEQYTGLRDKSGKEIFEGDVVHHKWNNPSDWIIEFHNGSFGFFAQDADTFDSLSGWEDVIEVIGNIHEGEKK